MRLAHLNMAAVLALGVAASPRGEIIVDDEPKPPKVRPEPASERRTVTPADEERIRAAAMKRARKAAKRLRDADRQWGALK